MRNRRRTIESLRRLVERPGTAAEGATARALLERMEGFVRPRRLFTEAEFPRFTKIYYNRWAYGRNESGVIVGKKPKQVQGQTWVRIKFDHLKSPRSVPVTSAKRGCHISKEPLSADESDYLKNIYEDAA
jgi:hypothetical protein